MNKNKELLEFAEQILKKEEQEDIQKIKYEVAKLDNKVARLPLFKPIKKGKREGGIEINTSIGNTGISIQMWRQLDIFDQSLFLVLMAMAGSAGKDTNSLAKKIKKEEKISSPGAKSWRHLWEQEKVDDKNKITKIVRKENNDFIFSNTIYIETTLYEVLKNMGYDIGGSAYRQVYDSLKRLSATGITILRDNIICGGSYTNIIGYYAEKNDNDDGKTILTVAINPLSAAIFLTEDNFIAINLLERIKLKSSITKAVHNYFSLYVNQGQSKNLFLDTLIEKIWNIDVKTLDRKLRSKKKKMLIAAIEEINKKLDWWEITFKENNPEIIIICHEKMKKRKINKHQPVTQF